MTRLSVCEQRRATCALILTTLLALACSGAQYRADGEHARLVAPVALADGDTGKAALPPKPSAGARQSAEAKPSSSPTVPSAERPSRSAATQEAGAGSERATVEAGPALAPPSAPSSAPDPSPLSSVRHYEMDFEYDAGRVSLARVRAVSSERAVTTARVMGRYALELWIGRELIERVRFDFPLIGAEVASDTGAALHTPPNLAAKAHVFRTVRVPADSRATWAQLVDRATGEAWRLEWPPSPAGVATPRPKAPAR